MRVSPTSSGGRDAHFRIESSTNKQAWVMAFPQDSARTSGTHKFPEVRINAFVIYRGYRLGKCADRKYCGFEDSLSTLEHAF